MKLSTSSSIFLATLALSSSSSTLAAPARDSTESALSVSPSGHDVFDSSVHSAAHCSAHRTQPQPTPVEVNSGAIAARSNPVPDAVAAIRELLTSVLASPILSPVVPVLETLLNKLSGQHLAATNGVPQEISAEDMATLQAAIQDVTRALNNNSIVSKAPMPSLVKTVAGSLPISVGQVGALAEPVSTSASAVPGSAAMSFAQASSTPSVAVNDVPSAPSALPSASATPPSPVIPVNPPNSPSPPNVPFPFL